MKKTSGGFNKEKREYLILSEILGIERGREMFLKGGNHEAAFRSFNGGRGRAS